MVTYERPRFGKTTSTDRNKNFKDSQVLSATVASTEETLLGKIVVPTNEIWILESIWCQGSGGEYRLNIGSFADATCDYNVGDTADPTINCDANTSIKVNQNVSGSLIPTGAFVSAVTEGGGAGTGVTTFELNASTDAGSAVTNGTLTFTEGNANANFNGKFIQNGEYGEPLKKSDIYSLDVVIKGRNVLCIYITNNAATSIVCKGMIQYLRYDITKSSSGTAS
tara:strand:+ start:202 stop:873 length:672 start_codon:yes stop_codon:yes gene_type:complete